MTTALYGGKINAFANSMAEEMEKALNEVRGEENMTSIPIGDRDRRMLFIAISRGVINHLKNKEQAFTIKGSDTGTSTSTSTHNHDGYTKIEVKLPSDVP